MTYKMFIDDERSPVTDDWVIVRSSKEAISVFEEMGWPTHIAFDHDLGGDDTSVIFINWLVEMILETKTMVPMDFTYSVHSQSPIGKTRIRGMMDVIISTLGE